MMPAVGRPCVRVQMQVHVHANALTGQVLHGAKVALL